MRVVTLFDWHITILKSDCYPRVFLIISVFLFSNLVYTCCVFCVVHSLVRPTTLRTSSCFAVVVIVVVFHVYTAFFHGHAKSALTNKEYFH